MWDPELQAGLRGVVLNRYIVFYTVTEAEVTIGRVLLSDRDLQSMFN
jgi:plasmid stabilization system protein ParE